jgi:hypothetical protein
MNNYCQSESGRNLVPENVWRLKVAHQVVCFCAQSRGDFDQGIHGRGFFASFNAADKNCRKPRLFSQFLLAESRFSPSRPNGVSKETAMFAGRHGHLGDRKESQPAMSLTTSFTCKIFRRLIETRNIFAAGRSELTFQRVKHEGIQTNRSNGALGALQNHPFLRPVENNLKEISKLTVL